MSNPLDICLWKTETAVREEYTFEGRTQVTVEHRAWVCPICEQSEEYFVVNGCVVHGCGMRTSVSKGVSVSYCHRWQCQQEADRRLKQGEKKP